MNFDIPRSHGNKGRKQTPEQIRLRTESVARSKALWSEERHREFVNKIKEANKRRDPSWRAKMSASKKGTPAWNKGKKCPQYSGENHWNWGGKMPQESIEKMRKSLTGKKQSPELVQKRVDGRAGYSHSEETRQRISQTNKMLFETGGREIMAGANNPSWKGGISFEPYPTTWTFRLRESIRNRDGRTCQICGKKEDGTRLDVHHVDYDKRNIDPENLVALCHNCHCKTNSDRDQWINFFNFTQYFNQPLLLTGTYN